MKNSLKILIIAISLIIIFLLVGFSQKNFHKNNSEIPVQESTENSYSKNDCSGVTPEVQKILDKNKINLSRLNSIGEYESGSKLGYANSSTGYTYEVTKNELSEGGVQNSRMVVFNVCYKNRLILTRDLRFIFEEDDTYRGSFAFDFPPIIVSPNPTISMSQAKEIVYKTESGVKGSKPQLGYYDLNAGRGTSAPKNYTLAWSFGDGARVVLDAHTGKIIYAFNGIIVD